MIRSAVKRFQEPAESPAQRDKERPFPAVSRDIVLPAESAPARNIKISPRVDDLINQIGGGSLGYSTVATPSFSSGSFGSKPVSMTAPTVAEAPASTPEPAQAKSPSAPEPIAQAPVIIEAEPVKSDPVKTEPIKNEPKDEPAKDERPLNNPFSLGKMTSSDVPAPIPLKALSGKVEKTAPASKVDLSKIDAVTSAPLPTPLESAVAAAKAAEKTQAEAPKAKAPKAMPFKAAMAAKPVEETIAGKAEVVEAEASDDVPVAEAPVEAATTAAEAAPATDTAKKDLPFTIISSPDINSSSARAPEAKAIAPSREAPIIPPLPPVSNAMLSVSESLFSFATKPAAVQPVVKASEVYSASLNATIATTKAKESPKVEESAKEVSNPFQAKATAETEEKTRAPESAKVEAESAPEVTTAPLSNARTDANQPEAAASRPSLKDRFTAAASTDSMESTSPGKQDDATNVASPVNPFTGKPSLADKMQSKAALNPAPVGKIARPAAPRPEYVLPAQQETRLWTRIPVPVRYLLIAAAIFALHSLFMSWLHEDEPAPATDTIITSEGEMAVPALPGEGKANEEAVTVESSGDVTGSIAAPTEDSIAPASIPALPTMPQSNHVQGGSVRTAAPVAGVVARPIEPVPTVTVTPKAEVSGGSLSKATMTAPPALPSQPSSLSAAATAASQPEAPVGGMVSQAEQQARKAATAEPANSAIANTAGSDVVDEKKLLELLERP